MEDLSSKDWKPLTEEELHTLNPIGLHEGEIPVNRYLLARLLGERDRLHCVLEASLWTIEELLKLNIVEDSLDPEEEPSDLQKSINALRVTIEYCRKK